MTKPHPVLPALLVSALCLTPLAGCTATEDAAATTQSTPIGLPASAADGGVAMDANSPDGAPAEAVLTPEQLAEMGALQSQEKAALAAYEQELAPYKQTVPLGQTISLRNLSDATLTVTTLAGEQVQANVAKYVPWVGTLDVTLLDATLYDSLENAQETAELGTVLREAPGYLEEPRLLVMHIKVTNVDATPGFTSETPGEYFALDAFQPLYPYSDAAANSFLNYELATLATFDGAPEGLDPQSPYTNDFALVIGETRVLTIGWWVNGAIDPRNIIVRPSLSANNPGPITFDLGLGATNGGESYDTPTA